MGVGTWIKVAVVALLIIGLLGFATSPTMHEAAWDGISEALDFEAQLGELPAGGEPLPAETPGQHLEPAFVALVQPPLIT